MEVFNLKSETWKKIKNFECEKSLFSAVLLENKLLLIGGHRYNTNLNTVRTKWKSLEIFFMF